MLGRFSGNIHMEKILWFLHVLLYGSLRLNFLEISYYIINIHEYFWIFLTRFTMCLQTKLGRQFFKAMFTCISDDVVTMLEVFVPLNISKFWKCSTIIITGKFEDVGVSKTSCILIQSNSKMTKEITFCDSSLQSLIWSIVHISHN